MFIFTEMIYIASSYKHCNKIKEDIFIKEVIQSKSHKVRILPWNKLENIVNQNDLIIIKSIWGYHKHAKKFIKFLQNIKTKKVQLINDYKFIEWNINKKRYFSDLRKKINIIDFKYINLDNFNSRKELNNYIHDLWLENIKYVVIKPVISANGYKTFNVDREKGVNNKIFRLLKSSKTDFMIEPFLDEICYGEPSVIVINGEIQYCINRFPGILANKNNPIYLSLQKSHKLTKSAKYIMDILYNIFNEIPKIARIDFVYKDHSYKLMELELIDPDLYLQIVPSNIKNKVLKTLTNSILL